MIRVPARHARAVKLWATVQHPNVARVESHWPDGDHVIVETENINGRSLSALLETGPLSLVRAAHVIEQVLSGVGAAHAVGLVHGALGPARVMIGANLGDPDFVKLVDFVGASPEWVPPEGDAKPGPTTDLFAVGCLAYLTMTGLPPVDSAGGVTATNAKDAAPAARIPFGLSEWVARLMAASPQDRFQTADEARNALRRIYASRSMIRYGARPITERARLYVEPVAPAAKTGTRRIWIAAVVVLVLIGIAIGVWQWLG